MGLFYVNFILHSFRSIKSYIQYMVRNLQLQVKDFRTASIKQFGSKAPQILLCQKLFEITLAMKSVLISIDRKFSDPVTLMPQIGCIPSNHETYLCVMQCTKSMGLVVVHPSHIKKLILTFALLVYSEYSVTSTIQLLKHQREVNSNLV